MSSVDLYSYLPILLATATTTTHNNNKNTKNNNNNRPIRPVEIDSSSLSSKSSCTTHSSFHDLKAAWEHTTVKLPQHDNVHEQKNNISTPGKINDNHRHGGRRKHRDRVSRTAARSSVCSVRSYSSNLYTHNERDNDCESPYEQTTTATESTTHSGSGQRRVHGRRRDLAKKKKDGRNSGGNGSGRRKKGDLAKQFDEQYGGLLQKHLNRDTSSTASSSVTGGADNKGGNDGEVSQPGEDEASHSGDDNDSDSSCSSDDTNSLCLSSSSNAKPKNSGDDDEIATQQKALMETIASFPSGRSKLLAAVAAAATVRKPTDPVDTPTAATTSAATTPSSSFNNNAPSQDLGKMDNLIKEFRLEGRITPTSESNEEGGIIDNHDVKEQQKRRSSSKATSSSKSAVDYNKLSDKLQLCNNILQEFSTLQNEVMSLLMSNPSTAHSLFSSKQKQQQQGNKCEVCSSTIHPTIRCTVLTDDDTRHVSPEMLHKLELLKSRLESEKREIDNNNNNGMRLPPPRRLDSEISQPNERMLTDGAVCLGQEISPLSTANDGGEDVNQDGDGNNKPPGKEVLNAFLSSPTGLNWEDLVRSMKKPTGLEALVGQELIFNLDDDDVSDMGDSDDGGHHHTNKYVGDLGCMGNILTSYIKKKSEGTYGGNDNDIGPSIADTDASLGSISTKCWEVPKGNVDNEEKDVLKRIVTKVITGQVVVNDDDEEEAAAAVAPKQQSPPRTPRRSPPRTSDRNSLERKIERVVTKQEKQVAAKTITPLAPPPRTNSSLRSKWSSNKGGRSVWGRSSAITSRIGSAFSPIKASWDPLTITPTTPSTTLDATFDSSGSAFTSPLRRNSSTSSLPSGPTTFSPIEAHSNPQQPLHPDPISPKAQRSPSRSSSSDPSTRQDVHVAPRLPSSVAAQRAERQLFSESDPSDPPILMMQMSADDNDESSSAILDLKQPLLSDNMDETDHSAMKQESLLLVEPPMMRRTSDDVNDEDFCNHIRGATPSLDMLLDDKVKDATKKNDGKKDYASTVAPFPTTFDTVGNNTNNSGRENAKTVVLGWVDNEGNLVLDSGKKKPAVTIDEADSMGKSNSNKLVEKSLYTTATSTTVTDSSSNRSKSLSSSNVGEQEVEGSDSSVIAPPILSILPGSRSVNLKAPSCLQMAWHRVRKTRGEF